MHCCLNKRYLLFIVFLMAASWGFSQVKQSIRIFDSVSYAIRIDSLRNSFCNHKTIPLQYELPALIALSYFSELSSTRIVFKTKKIKTTLNTRPTIWSLIFRKKENRKYIIRINNKKKDSLVLFSAVPFNAKVGLLGHEFSHIIDYRQKSIFGVSGRGWSYGNKSKKEQFEKEIDSITIERGLGWQLYDWSEYVLEEAGARQKYIVFKKDIYLEPDEIKKIMLNCCPE